MSIARKRFVLPLLAFCLPLSICLFLTEVILRVFNLAPVEVLSSASQAQFETIPGVYAPNQDFVSYANPNLPHQITINSHGYRGEEFPLARPENELRVFMTGDSFMYGDLVDDDQTLPHQFEALLREQCPTARAINAGLAGSTIISQSQLIARAEVLDPDIVIVSFHENDIIDMQWPLWEILATNRELKSSFPYSFIVPILNRIALYNLVKNGMDRISANFQVVRPAVLSDEELEFERELLGQTKAEYARRLGELKEYLDRNGIPFVYVVFPAHDHLEVPEQLDSDSDKSVEWGDVRIVLWAERTARQHGVATLNLQSALLHGLPYPEAGYLWPHDGHPAPNAYALAAQELAAFPPLREAVASRCRQHIMRAQ